LSRRGRGREKRKGHGLGGEWWFGGEKRKRAEEGRKRERSFLVAVRGVKRGRESRKIRRRELRRNDL